MIVEVLGHSLEGVGKYQLEGVRKNHADDSLEKPMKHEWNCRTGSVILLFSVEKTRTRRVEARPDESEQHSNKKTFSSSNFYARVGFFNELSPSGRS